MLTNVTLAIVVTCWGEEKVRKERGVEEEVGGGGQGEKVKKKEEEEGRGGEGRRRKRGGKGRGEEKEEGRKRKRGEEGRGEEKEEYRRGKRGGKGRREKENEVEQEEEEIRGKISIFLQYMTVLLQNTVKFTEFKARQHLLFLFLVYKASTRSPRGETAMQSTPTFREA